MQRAMKYYSLFLLIAVGFGLVQCTLSGPPPDPPRIDYDKESIKLMSELTPQVAGTWNLRQVQIKRQSFNGPQAQLGILKDTVFQNLATLVLYPATKSRSIPRDYRYAEFEGTIQYSGKTYPVYFYLVANASWVVKKTGPQAFFLFDYNFSDGWHQTEVEERFLSDLGLVGDNFLLETTINQPRMIWRGLNRGVSQIDLQKQ
jgi:hypothetical protein